MKNLENVFETNSVASLWKDKLPFYSSEKYSFLILYAIVLYTVFIGVNTI